MHTVTKKELIDRIAEETGQKRTDVKRVVQRFLAQVMVELARGNRLEFRDFGVFEVKHRAPRIAQNPKTLQRVEVPAKRSARFKAGRLLKQGLVDLPGLEAALREMTEEDDGPVVHVGVGAGRVRTREAVNGRASR
jgi:integration host factor subunit beta